MRKENKRNEKYLHSESQKGIQRRFENQKRKEKKWEIKTKEMRSI